MRGKKVWQINNGRIMEEILGKKREGNRYIKEGKYEGKEKREEGCRMERMKEAKKKSGKKGKIG